MRAKAGRSRVGNCTGPEKKVTEIVWGMVRIVIRADT